MYLEHFGLQRPPFKITPDTSMFYSGNKRGAALDALIYAIVSGEGIIKVVGEVGSGKTMLCRMLELELDRSIEVVYIANPSLSPDNILHVIAFELKLNITPDSGKLEVMQALQKYLLEKHINNHQVVVFVEEAQSMPLETLEEIRLLSNLETNENKLLQMVLFGQPELDEKLRQPAIRQLKERITHNFYLDPFTAIDVYKYLNFRMRVVGYRGTDLFSPKLARYIERKSNGLTRRINILADKSLLAAFSDGRHNLISKHINLAAKDSDFGNNFNWQTTTKISTSFLIIISAIWTGTLLPELFKYTMFSDTPAEYKNKSVDTATQSVKTVPSHNRSSSTQPPMIQTSLAQTSLAQALKKQLPPTVPALASSYNTTNKYLIKYLQQTQQWLKTSENTHYTIQLILIDSWAENKLVNYIEKSSAFLDSQYIYLYQASIQGRNVYSVLYNEYPSRDLAISQLQQFSNWFLQSRPYLRTIKGIKADIRKTRQQLIDKDRALN